LIAGYRISTDKSELDVDAIHAYLTKSYWSPSVPLSVIVKSIQHSLCFGIFDSQQKQIGFARMITDYATFAYLADVYILEVHQGQGLSKCLLKEIQAHPDLQGLRRILLATKDAHGLYKQFGFKELANPQTFMELWDPKVYEKEETR
jgi:N-acetylglutamate synthase-like GNAT family acetyltransferase